MKKILLLILLFVSIVTLGDARTNPYVAGAIYSDAIVPTVTSCTIAADGTSVTLQFSEPVVTTGYDDNDCDLDCSTGGDDITLDTITGSGSSKAGLTADTTVVSGETCNLDCTIGADEIEDASGNDLANITSMACTNNSTQGAAAYCSSCSGTCAYCEDFEGATNCDDATDDENCRYTYTDTIGEGGTLDYGNAQTTTQCSSTSTKDIKLTRSGNNVSTLYDFGSSYTEVYVSGYVKVVSSPSLASGNAQRILEFQNASGIAHLKLQIINDGGTYKFQFNHFNQAVGAIYTKGTAYSVGTWYRFRMYWKANQAGSGVDFYIDTTQYTPDDTSTYNSNVRKIMYSAVVAADSSIEFDNIRIQLDAYPTCS
jgi:hypothetical protein